MFSKNLLLNISKNIIVFFFILFIIFTTFFNLGDLIEFTDNTEDNPSESSCSANDIPKSDKAKEFENKMAKLMSDHMNDFLSNVREEINEKDSSEIETTESDKLKDTYYDEVDFLQDMNSLVSKMDNELKINDSTNNSEESELKRNAEDGLEKEPKKKKE